MAADGKKMKSVQSSIWADCKMCKLVVIVLCLGSLPHISNGQTELENLPSSACYNAQGNAQRCMPVFVNAAFSKTVEATNTCGLTRPIEYCLQTGVTEVRKQCQICDAKRPGYSHPPEFMTDFNNNHNWTWWQSDTMLEGIQYPVVVNLTLNLSKYAYQKKKKEKESQKFHVNLRINCSEFKQPKKDETLSFLNDGLVSYSNSLRFYQSGLGG